MPSMRDRNILWNRKTVFYPWTMSNLINDASTDVLKPFQGISGDLASEIGTTEVDFQAMLMTTSGALDTGSAVTYPLMLIPYDLDPTKNVGAAVVWTHDNTAGMTTITWAVTFNVTNVTSGIYGTYPGTGATFAVAEPTIALDTVIGAQTSGAANQFVVANQGELLVSTRGIIKPASAGGLLLLNTAMFWNWRVLMSAGALTTKIYFLGLLLDYDVKKTWGPGKNTTTGYQKNYLDQSYAPAVTAA